MSFDTCIICFKHCCENRTIFCKKVSEICPLCNSIISEYILDPFRLPNPFTKGKESPLTIILRPSNGDFLNDYKLSDDLHIAIVNSEGHIFEFDKPGLMRNDFSKWQNCLALKIVPESWSDHWDDTIKSITFNDKKWSANNYDGDNFNCFNFVLEFMKELKYKETEFSNKEDFLSVFLIPRFQEALKFINFYRILKDVDYYFLPNS